MTEALGLNWYLLIGIAGILLSIALVVVGLRENISNKTFFNVSRLLALLSVVGVWYFGNILTKNTTKEIEANKLQTKTLELKLEGQKERAAQAEMDLINLQEKVKPRSISSAKVDLLIARLSEFPIKEINIASSLGDGEAISYANQLKDIFEASGWKVVSGIGRSIDTDVGILIFTSDQSNQNVPPLMNILSDAGIKIRPFHRPKRPYLQMFVGSKIIE